MYRFTAVRPTFRYLARPTCWTSPLSCLVSRFRSKSCSSSVTGEVSERQLQCETEMSRELLVGLLGRVLEVVGVRGVDEPYRDLQIARDAVRKTGSGDDPVVPLRVASHVFIRSREIQAQRARFVELADYDSGELHRAADGPAGRTGQWNRRVPARHVVASIPASGGSWRQR